MPSSDDINFTFGNQWGLSAYGMVWDWFWLWYYTDWNYLMFSFLVTIWIGTAFLFLF